MDLVVILNQFIYILYLYSKIALYYSGEYDERDEIFKKK